MQALRITIAKPMPGRREELERLFDELEEVFSKQEGYIMGGRFASADASDDIGRFGLWTSPEAADRVANLTPVLALRSRIHLEIQPGHIERLLELSGKPKNVPTSAP